MREGVCSSLQWLVQVAELFVLPSCVVVPLIALVSSVGDGRCWSKGRKVCFVYLITMLINLLKFHHHFNSTITSTPPS